MGSAARRLPYLLLGLLVWGLSVPVIAVTCVPSAPCAGLMEAYPLGHVAERPGAAVGSPDCCEREVRDSEPPARTPAKLQALDLVGVAATLTLVPPAPAAPWRRTSPGSPPAPAVPLYTLHSILLI